MQKSVEMASLRKYLFILLQSDNLTIKPEVSVTAFVWLLLRRLRADGYQTWQEGRGRLRIKHDRVCFHGNLHDAMATPKTEFLWAGFGLVDLKLGNRDGNTSQQNR